MVERYADRFGAALTAIAADTGQPAMTMLDRYLEPYLQFAGTPDRVCLCGALAGEMPALPAAMRDRVARFFAEHQAWLADILERGRRRGEFVLADEAPRVARLVFSALQGALLVKRTSGDDGQLDDVIAVLKRQLTGGTGAG
ncbi:MAG: TetR-like C-terminal domain-containing protein [Thalassobaculum sp.]|uniref:TetR-like C-terminal domain-containing protein n=1 Tax=Thalassobaculum sp. TaxID=2022740 RepID=UPI0032EEC2F4